MKTPSKHRFGKVVIMEFIVVVAIIAVLTLMIIPIVQRVRDDARKQGQMVVSSRNYKNTLNVANQQEQIVIAHQPKDTLKVFLPKQDDNDYRVVELEYEGKKHVILVYNPGGHGNSMVKVGEYPLTKEAK